MKFAVLITIFVLLVSIAMFLISLGSVFSIILGAIIFAIVMTVGFVVAFL